jgi:uncharacterized protein YbaR (Trm112 family)
LNCPHCKTNLSRTSASGEQMLSMRGLILKANGLTLVCPKCKGDVPVWPDAMHEMHRRIVLFFQRS